MEATVPIQPSGTPHRQPSAQTPAYDQSTAEWLVPLIIGGAVTAGLAALLTPAGAAGVAAVAGPTLFGSGAAGMAAAGTGGGVAQQLAAKGMESAPPEALPSQQLRHLATGPLNAPGGGQRQPAASGGQAKKKAQVNPFTAAFRSGLA